MLGITTLYFRANTKFNKNASSATAFFTTISWFYDKIKDESQFSFLLHVSINLMNLQPCILFIIIILYDFWRERHLLKHADSSA